jgi:hypothetical protein
VIATFGSPATRYAQTLHEAGFGDLEAVICDVDTLVPAHVELRRRRYDGRPAYGMILTRDKRWQAIASYTPAILQQCDGDYDNQLGALSLFGAGTLVINNGPETSSSLWAEPIDESIRWLVTEFCLLADALLVRSFAEYQRLVPFMKRPRTVETIVAEPRLPALERRPVRRPSVVVWAPNRTPIGVAYHVFGLREFYGDITCVTAPGPLPPGTTARFLERADSELSDVLATASCVVCVDPDDPGDAVAFARAGYGVVSPLTSGAYEYVRHVSSLKGDHVREVYIATMIAAGQPASVRAIAAPPSTPEKTAFPAHSGELPLVTIITPTYNRRDDLPIMLKCLAAQTYPRIEAIVINDCGESVADIVARFPFARLLQTEANMGSHRAVERYGLPAMTGEYVCFLADDDFFMPDHIERMVAAMLRSGMAIAHGNAAIRYQEKNAKGEIVTTGSNVSVFIDTATPSEALVSTPIAGQALVFRVDAWNAFGSIRAESDLADQEMQLRAMLTYNFVYVDAVTCDWGVRGDRNFAAKVDIIPELRRVYDELYPLPDRPAIREQRERILGVVASRPKGKVAFDPSITWSEGP